MCSEDRDFTTKAKPEANLDRQVRGAVLLLENQVVHLETEII